MSLLWRANAFPLNNQFLREISALPFDQAIKLLLSDNRYTRYNLIWRDSNPIGNIPDWKNESWFGNFYDKISLGLPRALGLAYMAGVTPYQFWFHHQTLCWLLLDRKQVLPQVFSNNEQNWIYLYPETKVYFSHASHRPLKRF